MIFIYCALFGLNVGGIPVFLREGLYFTALVSALSAAAFFHLGFMS